MLFQPDTNLNCFLGLRAGEFIMRSGHKVWAISRLAIVAVLFGSASFLLAADWPMWRHDARRSAQSPEQLPAHLHLQWVREFPPLEPAWPDQPKMELDSIYQPIVAGDRLFIASAYDDTLSAFDVATGDNLWTYWAEGPIRYAPLAWKDRVYFACDDGCLYCLSADSGKLKWKFYGAPQRRRILGNKRLISTWPARGAPALSGDRIYFAAGIWPFMGVFIHCLDAETGQVVWTNDGDGNIYVKQPHNSDSFAGVAPQGPLVISGDKLLIPGGRSVPACYDRNTGKLLHYELAANGKRGGGCEVLAAEKLYANGSALFDLETGQYIASAGQPIAGGNPLLFVSRGNKCDILDLSKATGREVTKKDRRGKSYKTRQWTIPKVGEIDLPNATAMIVAGSCLYAGAPGIIRAVGLPGEKSESRILWEHKLQGTPATILAAAGRLFVGTKEGTLYCFGGEKRPAVRHSLKFNPISVGSESSARAKRIIDATGVRAGYAVAWGIGHADVLVALVQQSDLDLIVIEPDSKKGQAFRARLRAAGVPCSRISVYNDSLSSAHLPPYLANLMIVQDWKSAGIEPTDSALKKMYASLRPFGGVLRLPAETKNVASVVRGLPQARVTKQADAVLLIREGPLPGSANWTHEHADAANTRVSKDRLVKAPLGLLWFGGSSHEGILPRHGHGPQPQVIDGRLIIEGVHKMRCLDIYTGRILWETYIPNVGLRYSDTAHQPGANGSGANYVSLSDGIYVAADEVCLRLDPKTGRVLSEFRLPADPRTGQHPIWAYVNAANDYLIGAGDPFIPDEASSKLRGSNLDTYSSSRLLYVMNRHTGKVLWSASARLGFRHNSICIGGNRLYCIDRLSGPELDRIKRRGKKPSFAPRLLAFDLATGDVLWQTEKEVFGTALAYSEKYDLLVENGLRTRDVIRDEADGIRVYQAATGKVKWHNKDLDGPVMLHGDTILLAGQGCDLLTGKPKMRIDPISGKEVPWKWSRNYGCNMPAASEFLLTFRSGAAGFFDLCNDGGTGNLGGFRSSCTNNLIVAGGLLNAPDYTRTCSCGYQNQTSLALVHMPNAEMWTFFGSGDASLVNRVGINFGAPGDRKTDTGTLWLEYPSVGGKSPTLDINIHPEKPDFFRRHSALVKGQLPWVTASGAQALESVTVAVTKEPFEKAKLYTVILYFAEPENRKPGERIFDVHIQGKPVLSDFDIVKEAGGRFRTVRKEFKDVAILRDLQISLRPKKGKALLCGVEILAQ
ncbi:MAG: hypothetical protein KatS3mg105_2418 [Gemmatales bacterium]|nr:MAG: hypothetical protein KatS3mg105_2418 [Gemmatales bacterium]